MPNDRGSHRREGAHRLRRDRHAQRHRRPRNLFVFLGGKANLIKIFYWDGTGLCHFTKRLEHRIFEWPTVGGTGETVSLTSAQLAMLIEGIDWRSPDRS